MHSGGGGGLAGGTTFLIAKACRPAPAAANPLLLPPPGVLPHQGQNILVRGVCTSSGAWGGKTYRGKGYAERRIDHAKLESTQERS